MCKMNKFPKKTLLRALRGIRSFAHSENLRIFLIKLMCSDLHSGSGSCIKDSAPPTGFSPFSAA